MGEDIIGNIESEMNKVLEFTKNEVNKFKVGKADPSILEDIKIFYYDNLTPISQIALINVVDIKTITIKPYEKKFVKDIAAAIVDKKLGLNPQDDGEVVKIYFPPITEERRKELVKIVKGEGEKAKISIRNIRKNFKDKTKDLKKNGISEDEIKRLDENIQNKTDLFIKNIDKIVEQKEVELMKV